MHQDLWHLQYNGGLVGIKFCADEETEEYFNSEIHLNGVEEFVESKCQLEGDVREKAGIQ